MEFYASSPKMLHVFANIRELRKSSKRMLQKIKNGKHSSLDNLTFGVTFAKNLCDRKCSSLR